MLYGHKYKFSWRLALYGVGCALLCARTIVTHCRLYIFSPGLPDVVELGVFHKEGGIKICSGGLQCNKDCRFSFTGAFWTLLIWNCSAAPSMPLTQLNGHARSTGLVTRCHKALLQRHKESEISCWSGISSASRILDKYCCLVEVASPAGLEV